MRPHRILAAASWLALCSTASAGSVDLQGPDLALVATRSLDQGEGRMVDNIVAPNAAYSNVTTFLGSAAANGGAATASGNTITRLLADDLTLMSGSAGAPVIQFAFNIANFNSAATSARPRVRFYDSDGSGGGPGTLLTGFSFNAISFPASSVNTYTAGFSFAVPAFIVPASEKIWAGVTFDNNSGATGATVTTLNNLGMGIFDPVDVGSSADLDFLTTAAGSHFVSNPAGTNRVSPFSGNPVANYGWEMVVPEPASLGAIALMLPLVLRRRTQGN